MNPVGIRGWPRRTLLQAMGAAGVGLGLSLPSTPALSQATGKLTVGSLAFPNWCQLAAAEQFGWLKAEGVDGKLDVKYFESGPPEIEAGIGGNLQLMGLGAGPVINALAAGALPLRILGSVNEVTSLFGLVAQKGIGTIADLRGKKIAVTLGSNYQYFLEAALADAGMTTKDVTIIDSDPNEGTISFVAGRVDATVPDYTDIKLIPRRMDGAKVILSGTDIGKTNGISFRIFDLWVAPQKALENNRATIEGVLRAVSRWADFVGNPATHTAAIDFAVSWGSKISSKALVRADIEATMEGAHFFDAAGQKKLADDGALAQALKQHAEFLFRLNRLKRVPDFDSLVEKSFW
jgi:ABC-type nitrate/sulfonate/bicarbonate transport system substrate-binding protein